MSEATQAQRQWLQLVRLHMRELRQIARDHRMVMPPLCARGYVYAYFNWAVLEEELPVAANEQGLRVL